MNDLLQLVYSHALILIVAFSSGIGSQVSGRVNTALQYILLSNKTEPIHLQHFTKGESELALKLHSK